MINTLHAASRISNERANLNQDSKWRCLQRVTSLQTFADENCEMAIFHPSATSYSFPRKIVRRAIIVIVLSAVLALIALLAVWWRYDQKTMQIEGLTLINAEMTSEEVLSLLGSPNKKTATTMRQGIYGVPGEIEKKIGHGSLFEKWDYETSSSSSSHRATVWMVPNSMDPPEDMQVLDVTISRMGWSLWYRFCHSPVGERLQDALGIDD